MSKNQAPTSSQKGKGAKKSRKAGKSAVNSEKENEPSPVPQLSEEAVRQLGTGELPVTLQEAMEDRSISVELKHKTNHPLMLHIRVVVVDMKKGILRSGEIVGRKIRKKDSYNIRFDDTGKVQVSIVLRLSEDTSRKYGRYGVDWTVITDPEGQSSNSSRPAKRSRTADADTSNTRQTSTLRGALKEARSKRQKSMPQQVSTKQCAPNPKESRQEKLRKITELYQSLLSSKRRGSIPEEMHGAAEMPDVRPGNRQGTVWGWTGESRAEQLGIEVPNRILTESHAIAWDCDRLATIVPSLPFIRYAEGRIEQFETPTKFPMMRGITNQVLPNIITHRPFVLSADFRAAGTTAKQVCKIFQSTSPNGDLYPWRTQKKKRDLTVAGQSVRLHVE